MNTMPRIATENAAMPTARAVAHHADDHSSPTAAGPVFDPGAICSPTPDAAKTSTAAAIMRAREPFGPASHGRRNRASTMQATPSPQPSTETIARTAMAGASIIIVVPMTRLPA